MHKTPLLAAAASAALFALSACHQSQPEMVNTYDPQAQALRNAAPVQLPPAITDTSNEVPPRSQVIMLSKPAPLASAAPATTPAAGPDRAVRTGNLRAPATDIVPPFDCTMCT